MRLQLNLGCGNYDQTRALMDGRVQPVGIDLKYTLSFPADTFPLMVRDKAFDVCELGFTYYLGTLAQPNPPFVAIPVYPIRFFPQSAIFVNSDSGIKEPKDLIGRRLAELFIYGHDAGTWAKGVLSDDYGVPARGVSYKVGGLDRPAARWDWLPFDTPPDVQVQQIGPDQTLDALLESGEIDALYSAMVPPSLVKGSRRVRYLFQNHEAAGRDYFRIVDDSSLRTCQRKVTVPYPGLTGHPPNYGLFVWSYTSRTALITVSGSSNWMYSELLRAKICLALEDSPSHRA